MRHARHNYSCDGVKITLPDGTSTRCGIESRPTTNRESALLRARSDGWEFRVEGPDTGTHLCPHHAGGPIATTTTPRDNR